MKVKFMRIKAATESNNKKQWLPWFVLWSGLVVVCVVVGIYTRLGYTDVNSSPDNILSLPYRYFSVPPENQNLANETTGIVGLNASEDVLVSQSPVIVECIFDGNRKYLYQSFLSEVRILTVYKGDGIEVGQTIKIFEPVRITNKAETGQFAIPSGMYNNGYTMMKKGSSYLVFLSAKEYSPYEDRSGKMTEYVFQEHPYAKLGSNDATEKGAYIVSDEAITVGELSEYDIVVSNASDKNLFATKKKALLETVMRFSPQVLKETWELSAGA
jgi:hypothetical protein